MIKSVVFDIGGVLVNCSIETVRARVVEKLGLKENVFSETLKEYAQVALGKTPFEEYFEFLRERYSLKQNAEELMRAWKEADNEVMTVNAELVAIVKELKKHYRVGLISNANPLFAKGNEERGLLQLFDPCLVSCYEGLAKPDKKIFERYLEKSGLPAKECVFIDDRERHVNAARELGFHAVLFEDNEQLLRELRALGVTI